MAPSIVVTVAVIFCMVAIAMMQKNTNKQNKDFFRIFPLFLSNDPTETQFAKFLMNPNVYSMVSKSEVVMCGKLLKNIIKQKIPGCIVETGVWRGGMLMYFSSILQSENENRKIYGFDTFSHFPAPSLNNDSGKNESEHKIHKIIEPIFQNAYHSVEEIQQNFEKLNLDFSNVHLIKGEFKHTVPRVEHEIQKIAMLRLDNDYYDSTYYILTKFYDKIVPGGYVVFHNYTNPHIGCKLAVDTFRRERNITTPVINTDCVYWQI